MKVILVASLLTTASAACANACSNHGSCGEHDKCACDPQWQGGDCSLAKCPFGASWSQPIDGQEYSECSSRGECDRKTGTCACAPGYSGASCQRTECENQCSGHGVCGQPSTTGRVAVVEQQSCECDAGWTGVSCAVRLCAHGDDPLTKANYDPVLKTSISQADEVQQIKISSDGLQAFSVDTFTLTYTDPITSAKYTTYPLYQFALTAGKLERALENLPDGILSNVTVTNTASKATGSGNQYNEFQVTFVSNPGDLKPIEVNSAGCNTAGCTPAYYGCSGAGCTVTTSELTKGTKENIECAGRGTCDREAMTCACFSGFYGLACDQQSILA